MISKYWIVAIGIVSVLIVGIIDYWIVIDLSLSICYLIPIIVVTRYVNKMAGILLSGMSTISWYIAEGTAKSDLHPLILLWNTLVRLTVFLIVVHLLSALKNAYEREKSLARVDELTKVFNRRYFLENLKLESKRTIRYRRCLTLVYFDVDNFKLVNDRFGHAQGDRLLNLVASTVNNNIRETDIFARLGGDEFALLLPETNYSAAQIVLQRIQKQLTIIANENFFDVGVGFSIGAVTFLKIPESVEYMLEQVDSLMYQVKSNGKNGLKHQLYDFLK